jgi:hypothetical protein
MIFFHHAVQIKCENAVYCSVVFVLQTAFVEAISADATLNQ